MDEIHSEKYIITILVTLFHKIGNILIKHSLSNSTQWENVYLKAKETKKQRCRHVSTQNQNDKKI